MFPLRHTIRLLLKSPGFTITAILILGFGIGTNTAIFSLVQAVILKPLPYPDPASLIQVFLTYQGNENAIDYPDYVDISAAQHSFKSMAAVSSDTLDWTGQGNPERLKVDFITASMFDVTGLPCILGRPFNANEDVSSGPLFVVISEHFWSTRFNGDPNIVGKNLTLSERSFQIIGVVTRQINWWSPCDIYVPINTFDLFYPGTLQNRGAHVAACFGRLSEGIGLANVRAELDAIHKHLIAQYPNTDKGYGIKMVTPGRGDYTVYDYSPALWLLAAGVSCLLLISCANITNLLLARSLHRRKEISVRAMLGAGPRRLATQLLLETAFLSLLEKAQQLPGVKAAALNDFPPFYYGDLDWGAMTPFTVVGQPDPGPGGEPKLDWHTISPGYFQSLRIPLLLGRDFAPQDDMGREKVVVIDEALAESYFPKQNPLGHQITVGDTGDRNTCTIVGVVPHLRCNRPSYPQRSFQAYFPYTQYNYRDQVLVLRTSSNPESLTAGVRKLVASIDPDLPVTRIEPLTEVIDRIYAPERIDTCVVCLFSGAALFLSAVGFYGVLAYAVSQRTREIGIRIAVGAPLANILQLVIRQGLKLAGIGMLIGVTVALTLSRLMSSILYGVSANDPISLLIAILVLGVAAFVACLLPALRAVRIDPIRALRE